MACSISLSKKDGHIVIGFGSCNVVDLHIKYSKGKGYKQGDLVSIKIVDGSGTQVNYQTGFNQVNPYMNMTLSGYTEMETFIPLFDCLSVVMDMFRMGFKEMEVVEFLNTVFRKKYDDTYPPQDLSEFKHKMYVGKYKGKTLDEVDDLPYLQWFAQNVKHTSNFEDALLDRISTLSNLLK